MLLENLTFLLKRQSLFYPAIFSIAVKRVVSDNGNALNEVEIEGCEPPKKKSPESLVAQIYHENHLESDFVHTRSRWKREETGGKFNKCRRDEQFCVNLPTTSCWKAHENTIDEEWNGVDDNLPYCMDEDLIDNLADRFSILTHYALIVINKLHHAFIFFFVIFNQMHLMKKFHAPRHQFSSHIFGNRNENDKRLHKKAQHKADDRHNSDESV